METFTTVVATNGEKYQIKTGNDSHQHHKIGDETNIPDGVYSGIGGIPRAWKFAFIGIQDGKIIAVEPTDADPYLTNKHLVERESFRIKHKLKNKEKP